MPKPFRLPNLAEQHVLDHLQVRLIEPHEKDAWNQLVVAHHYLKNADLVGAQLRYVAQYECRWLLLLGWSAAAFHLQAREQWLRWSQSQLRARRHFVAQNSRLVLLADRHQFPNLASRALALCSRRLSDDWQTAYGHPIVVVESFVDRQLFHGTAYKAAGWTLLGPTAGFGRHAEDFYVRHDRPKQLWVRPLDPAGPAALRAPTLPPHLAPFEQKPAPRCTLPATQRTSLLERLPRLPDARRPKGRWHPWRAVLGILALAKLAGVPGAQSELADFAARLTQAQRRQLSCRRDPASGRYAVPGASTFFRALKAMDYLALERVVVQWQHDVLGPADPNELIVLDGKEVANAQGQNLVTAVSVPSGRVYGLEPVRPKEPAPAPAPPEGAAPSASAQPAASSAAPHAVVPPPSSLESVAPSVAPACAPPALPAPKKENEIPAARRLLARLSLAGRLVSLDALHTQHATAGQIVLGNGADYLLTLKANQEGLLETAQTLLPGVFFPSGLEVLFRAHGAHGRKESGPAGNPATGHAGDHAGGTGPDRRQPSGPSGPPPHGAWRHDRHADVAGDQPADRDPAAGRVPESAPRRMGD
jgi:predicted transposase YbfD/YdcC